MRIGEVVLQRGTRKRDHLRDAILCDVARERIGVIARNDRDRLATALLREFEARVDRGQCGFREVSLLVLSED